MFKKKVFVLLLIFLLFSGNINNKMHFVNYVNAQTTEEEINELEEKIKKESEEITENEEEITEMESKIKSLEKEIRKLNEQINGLQKDIQKREETISTYLVFVQKFCNKKLWLTQLQGEDILLYIYNLNSVVEYMQGDFLSLKASENDLKQKKETLRTTSDGLKEEKKDLEEKTKKMDDTYEKLNEQLLDLEKEIDFNIKYDNKAYVKEEKREDLMASVGIEEEDYDYVNYIISNESSWNYKVKNPFSGAYGLCQALPGEKMAVAGEDWLINPETQMTWCNGYAISRYGSWEEAQKFWVENNWW